MKFKGIDNINDIEKYKGKSLLVDREHAVKLRKDEYFIADMIGMDVFTEEEKFFGTLKDVQNSGANDVYIVEMEEGKEVLIPAIKQCILDVDVEKKKNGNSFTGRAGIEMHFHILTLFPEMVMNGLSTSIIGRAMAKGLLTINADHIWDFAENKHNRVNKLYIWRRSRNADAGRTGLRCVSVSGRQSFL